MRKLVIFYLFLRYPSACRPINQNKTFISPLIPGKLDTYIYEKERDYYDMYFNSLFALTYKKAGWDCLRHYEILANGCILYF